MTNKRILRIWAAYAAGDEITVIPNRERLSRIMIHWAIDAFKRAGKTP